MIRPSLSWLRSGLSLALVAVASGSALAQAPVLAPGIDPDVAAKREAALAAKGPEVYAALRELWRTWDRADPTQVEEAIASVAESPTASPNAKVYAELLGAYARRRRGDLDGASTRIARLGFLHRFITVGPFDNQNKDGFPRTLAPELELAEPIVPGRTFDGKERPVRWRVPPESGGYGWFDFGDLLRPREQVCGLATAFVRAKAATKAPRDVTLWLGASGAVRVYWGEKAVLEDGAYRELDIDRVATKITLAAEYTRLTVKACGDDDAAKFALRIADARGTPDLGFEIAADPEVSTKVSERMKAARPATPTAKASKPKTEAPEKPKATLGPIPEFEAMTEGAKARPEALEAYARYLAVTGGNPAAEHKARDLARRAAEAAPTVRRLLFAGSLAEDRNQRREWIERAVALAAKAGRGDPRSIRDVDVLLAQAELARTGTNWRDAVPIYERILTIDPDNTLATLGRVGVYVEAGLKRTALATLEDAVRRKPSAVALLRVYASELRSVGRDTEADEIESRYSALRFDDSGWLGQRVELAVARRDPKGAERWLERLLRAEPDSAWARAVAARTYRSLGQGERARAAYQRALSMAPEDTGSLRALADLSGEDGDRAQQLSLLRQILAIHPQAKDVREYVERIEPPRPRRDEAYAWPSDKVAALRGASQAGTRKTGEPYPKRTLRDLTVTTVFPNGLSSSFRQVVFQPLTEEAAASSRQYAFPYHADRQTVELRAARVYRADGKVDEAIESGEGAANDPSIAMYTSMRTFYVSFPRLEPGDLVELRYRVEDVVARNEIADSFGEIQYLQSDEPIGSSEYVLITPKERSLQVFASPIPGLTKEVTEDATTRTYRWAAKDVPPLAPEPGMPPWSELLAHVHVSTFKSWDDVGAFYWGLAREQLDVDDEVRRKVKEITKGLTDDRAKVRAVYRFATEVRYVALELGIEGIKPRRCALTLARGWGDCKDKATLIVTMLRELNIPATLVLVRTGMRGGIENEPASLAPFDHAIAYVPSLDLYLDGTAEDTGTDELPAMDRNAFALQINEGKPKLVHLPDPEPDKSVVKRKADVTLATDGSAQIGIELSVTGASASSYRQRYHAEGTRRDRAARDLASDFGPVELAPGKTGADVDDLGDIEAPARLRLKGKAATFARKEGDAFSVPVGPSAHMVADYAPLSTRSLDLVLHARTTREDEWVVRLPAGSRALALPVPSKLETPFGSLAVTVEDAKGIVTVKSRLVITKSRITPTEYAGFRTFCEAVDRAFGQRVVVGK